jgi:tetratricopeptide (TPR) repeat protein
MRLTGERLKLDRGGRHSNPWRMLLYLALIVGGVLLLRLEQTGQVEPLFLPTPGPTRSAQSFADEAEVHFSAGDLERAITAYQTATSLEPHNAELWAKLTRVQTYSSSLLTTLDARQARLTEARESIDHAIAVEPENAIAHAMRTLVYDWSATAEIKESLGIGDKVKVQAIMEEDGRLIANIIELVESSEVGDDFGVIEEETTYIFSGELEAKTQTEWIVSGQAVEIDLQKTLIRDPNRREEFIIEATTSAVRALELDPDGILAIAFYAELLVDQQKFALALDNAKAAADAVAQIDTPYEYAMDVYRVYGTVLEHLGMYLRAIEEYQKAMSMSPNLTFLHLSIGVNYRQLRDIYTALDYFDKAAKINQQLGIKDPTPYLAIGKTYQQQGEFFIAAINIERALAIDSGNPEIFARLGRVYFQARNWETAIPVFKCALDGCTAFESGQHLCDLQVFLCIEDETDVGQPNFIGEVEGMAGDSWTVAGKKVTITPQTEIEEAVEVGDIVKVEVVVNDDYSITAQEIILSNEGDLSVADTTALQVGRDVIGMELNPNTLEYYYTYGSVLAAFAGHPDYPGICTDAERIFFKLDAEYGSDPVVSAIVDEGRMICTDYASSPELIPTPTSVPDGTP